MCLSARGTMAILRTDFFTQLLVYKHQYLLQVHLGEEIDY
jgi:hypothetical protein